MLAFAAQDQVKTSESMPMSRKWRFNQAAPIYVAQLCAALMTLIVAPIVVRNLGLEIFGVYASLLTASQMGLIISEYSFDAVGPRLFAERPSQGTKIYYEVIVAKLPTIFAGIGFSITTLVLITGKLPSILDIVNLAFVIVGTAMLSPWYFIASQRTMLYASLVGGARIFSTVAVLLSIFFIKTGTLDGSAIFSLYAMPIGIAGCAAFYLTSRTGITISFDLGSLQLLKQGLPAFLGSSAISIQNIFSQFIIGLVAGPSNLGIYNAIDRPARILSSTLKPIFQTLYPHVARLHKEDPEEARRFNLSNLRFAAIMLTPVLVISTIFSEPIIVNVYGEQLTEYHHLLPIIIAWLVLGILNNFVGIQALQAAGRDKVYGLGMWLSLTIAVVGSVIFLTAKPYAYFVAGSVLAGEFAAFLVYSVVMLRTNAHRK